MQDRKSSTAMIHPLKNETVMTTLVLLEDNLLNHNFDQDTISDLENYYMVY